MDGRGEVSGRLPVRSRGRARCRFVAAGRQSRLMKDVDDEVFERWRMELGAMD